MPSVNISSNSRTTSLYSEAARYIEESNQLLKNDPLETYKRDEHAADSQVASLYYLSSIKSLTEIASPSFAQAKQNVEIAETAKANKSFVQSVKDWLWGCFGYNTSETVLAKEAPKTASDESTPLSGSPVLQAPEHLDKKRLSKAIAEINQTLLWRIKDMQEFEAELLKSNSKKMDKLLFVHIKNCSLDQRDLKQTSSMLAHENIHERHKEIKEIQKKTGALAEDLAHGKIVAKTVKWLNVLVTGGMVLGTGMAFLSGGATAVIQLALPIASVFKSGITLSDGIVKYQNGKREGDLMMHKENTRVHNASIHDKLEVVQNHDDEVASVLKALRKYLRNHSETERLASRFGKSVS